MRDCLKCVYDSREGCTSWGCEFIPKDEAVRAYQAEKQNEKAELELEKDLKEMEAAIAEVLKARAVLEKRPECKLELFDDDGNLIERRAEK